VLFAVGCTQPTSVLVSVGKGDVQVPADVDTLRFIVTNPSLDPSGANPIYETQLLPLCTSGMTGSCHTLPLSLTLYPGMKQPDAPIRVELDALLSGQAVIRDASVFSFLHNQSQHLDFFLSKRCLMTMCAATDLSCDRLGQCVPQHPTSPQPAAGPVQSISETDGKLDQSATGIAVPPGVATNDLVLMAMWVGGTGDTLTIPPDWQKLGEEDADVHSIFASHWAAPSDGASYAFTTTAPGTIWHMSVYRNVDTIDTLVSQTEAGGITQVVFPPLHTDSANAEIVLFAAVGNCVPNPPAQPVGADVQWTVASYAQPTPGAGTMTTMACAAQGPAAHIYEVSLAPR
jgi:hypothetical protein